MVLLTVAIALLLITVVAAIALRVTLWRARPDAPRAPSLAVPKFGGLVEASRILHADDRLIPALFLDWHARGVVEASAGARSRSWKLTLANRSGLRPEEAPVLDSLFAPKSVPGASAEVPIGDPTVRAILRHASKEAARIRKTTQPDRESVMPQLGRLLCVLAMALSAVAVGAASNAGLAPTVVQSIATGAVLLVLLVLALAVRASRPSARRRGFEAELDALQRALGSTPGPLPQPLLAWSLLYAEPERWRASLPRDLASLALERVHLPVRFDPSMVDPLP